MATRWAVSSSNWSTGSTWNDGATLGIPVAADDVFTNSFSVNIDQSFTVNSLNNNARARDIATPQMTSNSTPSPFVIFASSTSGGSNEPWRAFDRNITPATNVGWAAATGQLTGSIGVDFGSGSSIVIDAYDIVGYNQVIYNPRTWAFQGSNDNVAWTNLHIVSGASAIGASATYSVGSIGNTQGYRYYRFNITQNGGTAPLLLTELLLYQPGTAALAAGGSFIFNSGSISGSATSTTAALTAGATNLIQVTATTGSVTLSVSSSVTGPAIASATLISHTGNCDFNLNGISFTAGSGASGATAISKTSAGIITVRGNIVAGTSGAGVSGFTSTNGNTVVIGNVVAPGSAGSTSHGISQTAGNVTVTGNVAGNVAGNVSLNHGINLTGANSILIVTGNITGAGGAATSVGANLTGIASQFTIVGNIVGGSGTNCFGLNHAGTSGSVIGNVTGGSGATSHGINTVGAVTVTGTVSGGAGTNAHGILSSGILTVTGNVLGSVGAGIANNNNATVIGNITGGSSQSGMGTANAVTMNVTGNVTATSTFVGIQSTGTGTVNLTGNMINVSGRQAIYAQNLFISNAATSQWRLFTQGGQDKTLYSADTFPNQPTSANVRSGSLFGPANALSGSMVVPVPSDVRVNVLTDNTVGTGQSLTAADFLAAISSSADPFAERLRNVATVDTVGSLVTGLNGGF